MAAGLNIASAFSKPKTSPVFGWDQYERFFYPSANQYRNFARVGGEGDQLYNQYKESYLGGTTQAAENADIYRNYVKGLFENQPNQIDGYKQTGDYLYGQLDDFLNKNQMAGYRSMNDMKARLGLGIGSSGFSDKINADRITNNSVPAFMNTTNAIGRDYQNIAGNDMRQTLLRLGLASDDAMGGYADRVYERPLDVAGNRMGMINSISDAYSKLANNFGGNIAGWKTEETNNIARYAQPLDDFVNGGAQIYSGMYGGGGSFGNQGIQQPMMNQAQQYNPYLQQMYNTPQAMPQGGYPAYNGTNQYTMPPAQYNQFMNESYGTPGYNAGAGDPYSGMVGWDTA